MLIFKKNGAGKQKNAGRPAKNEQAPPQNSEAFNLPYESKGKNQVRLETHRANSLLSQGLSC